MKRTAIASVALLATLALAGCSAGMSDSGSYDMPAAAENGGGAVAADGTTQSQYDAADEERSQIITGYMTVTVDTPAEAAKDAIRLVEGVNGRIDGRQEYAPANGDKGSAQLTLRIPATALDATIEKLGALGTVVEISTTADDVSSQVKDVDARVKSLQASVDRLTALLATAKDVDQLVSIESSLTQRQGELESMLAQQRSLGDQVSLATITLSLISEEDAPPPPAPVTFLTGLEAGWNAFVTFISGAVVVIGVLLPWLVFFGLVAAIVIVIVRWRRRRSAAEGSPTIAP
jgi:hypothetical protein